MLTIRPQNDAGASGTAARTATTAATPIAGLTRTAAEHEKDQLAPRPRNPAARPRQHQRRPAYHQRTERRDNPLRNEKPGLNAAASAKGRNTTMFSARSLGFPKMPPTAPPSGRPRPGGRRAVVEQRAHRDEPGAHDDERRELIEPVHPIEVVDHQHDNREDLQVDVHEPPHLPARRRTGCRRAWRRRTPGGPRSRA